MKGVAARLYRQDDLMAAKPSQVLIVEGEKDVDALREHEVLAVTNHGGAGKWKSPHTAALKKAGVKTVVVIPDSDEPGREHGHKVAASCKAAGLAVKWLRATGERRHRLPWVERPPRRYRRSVSSAADWTPPAVETKVQVTRHQRERKRGRAR